MNARGCTTAHPTSTGSPAVATPAAPSWSWSSLALGQVAARVRLVLTGGSTALLGNIATSSLALAERAPAGPLDLAEAVRTR